MDLVASRSLARAALPSEGNDAGKLRTGQPSPTRCTHDTYTFADRALIASIIGLALCVVWTRPG
jgi:hypothetical protein